MWRTVSLFLLLSTAAAYVAVAQPAPTPAPSPLKPTNMIMPPLEYDHPFKGDVIILERDSVRELVERCRLNRSWALGCAIVFGDQCFVYLVKEDIIKAAGWTRAEMLRHEIGHCNGWAPDHPGQRPRGAPPRDH